MSELVQALEALADKMEERCGDHCSNGCKVCEYRNDLRVILVRSVALPATSPSPEADKRRAHLEEGNNRPWPSGGIESFSEGDEEPEKALAAAQPAPAGESVRERRQIECDAILALMGKEPYLAKGHVEDGEYKWTVVADKVSVTELRGAALTADSKGADGGATSTTTPTRKSVPRGA